ncbi:26S proteasome non-ATPase regulatory subunit 5 [Dillenia turbinata]|uniref:26S proteasome non-ATPase regulatory subunit 5 n=1 Tax=Dillenia turbinata TaxID=194707 RepID=A0AAN8WBF3_9MAGN
MEEYSLDDPTSLLEAASDFANHPGVQTDDSAKDFLDRFPLPVIINVLQTKADVPGVENNLVACLERIFQTNYGGSLIPQFLVSCLLDKYLALSATKLIVEYDIYPLLLSCLVDGDEQVATASMDAIRSLASNKAGTVRIWIGISTLKRAYIAPIFGLIPWCNFQEIVFPADNHEATHLGNLSSRCSSLGRVRVLALVVKLFSISYAVASSVYNSKLLNLLEAEVSNTDDILVTLSVLELFYELAEVEHGTEFLSRTTLLKLLGSIISNTSADSVLRSRAMMIAGRLLSKENIYAFVDESSVKTIISAIDIRLLALEGQNTDECESAVEAMGQIGSSIRGAALLLSGSRPPARHVVQLAFDQQVRGKQLAALHALGHISGESRDENNVMLDKDAEETLRSLVYAAAAKTSKLAPSGLFLSVLQQGLEIRLAGYRLITGLVARPWCLSEICSKPEIINMVTDPYAETQKVGMEARYNCCKAVHKALMSSSLNVNSNPTLSGVAAKLQEAVRRGPYLATKNTEAQPVVMTAERF